MEERSKRVILVAILLASSYLLILNFSPIEKKEIPTSFLLSERPGFDLEPGQLTFGGITPNQSGSRDIEIKNDNDKRVKISIRSSGEASKNIIVSENNFYLDPMEAKNVTFTAFTHGLNEYKKYTGQVEVLIYKA